MKRKKGTVRVNKPRSKVEPAKGGLGLIDITPFWMGGKIGWLRRILQKEYNEAVRTNYHHKNKVWLPKLNVAP